MLVGEDDIVVESVLEGVRLHVKEVVGDNDMVVDRVQVGIVVGVEVMD